MRQDSIFGFQWNHAAAAHLRNGILLKPCGNSFILHYSIVVLVIIIPGTPHGITAMLVKKRMEQNPLCKKRGEFEAVFLPLALLIFPELCRCESECCRSALLILTQICFGDFYRLRGRSQPHFFSMYISTNIRNFLIFIFSQFVLTVRHFQRWF